jgi:hypothetical protein
MKIGPLAVFTNFTDEWLISRQARTLFLISTVLTLVLTALFLSQIDIAKMTLAQRLPVSILGMVGIIALVFIWAGMWRYWYRLDDSGGWSKRICFLLLLLGLWWGSCIYFLFVYLPRVSRYKRAHV